MALKDKRLNLFSGIRETFTFHVHMLMWKWQAKRRSRNPELVELDAYRTLKDVDDKLKKWPSAIPLLEAGLKAAKVTGQEDKWYSYAVRLRDYVPPTKNETERIPSVTLKDVSSFREREPVPEEMKADYLSSIKVIRETNRASVSHFQRKLYWGYNRSASVIDMLESRGVIGAQDGAGPREILSIPNVGHEFD